MVAIFAHSLPERVDAAARLFTDQSAYQSVVVYGAAMRTPPLAPRLPERGSMLRGSVAAVLAVVIALVTVFWRRNRFCRVLDLAERGIPVLRDWQSGHPGDYVLWITVGTITLGACFVLLLR
jgi:hypothetical protein